MKKISKASMNRLLKSKFFHDTEEIVKAWDYYLLIGAGEEARGMMHKWQIAKLALEHITGNSYGLSRDGAGNYSIVNEKDHSDRIVSGSNQKAAQ